MSTELRPFDLEKAMAGETVVTRDGRKVCDVRHFPSAREDCRVGVVICGDLHTCREDGIYVQGYEDRTDLFMAPKPPELVPWDCPDDVPVGAEFRHVQATMGRMSKNCVLSTGIETPSASLLSWADLHELYRYTTGERDDQGKLIWHRCGKESK